MPTHLRLRSAAAFVVAGGLVVSALVVPRAQTAPAGQSAATASAPVTLPARLTDVEFWKLSNEFSEPNGYFRSDNLLSNEIWFQYLVPELQTYLGKGGVYLGVGPEQNFTYIAALEPRMVIIFDIRRGNMHTHLMYKALFELSSNRAEFVSMLFSRQKPAELTKDSTVQQIFTAVFAAPTSQERYKENLKRITDHLTKTHGLPLAPEDLAGIDYVYGNFHYYGPGINYNSSQSNGGGRGAMSTYASLMTATDGAGVSRSYLANEALFTVMKDLHTKNLLVPVVGDFAGPKAIRSVGKYLKAANATVSAFYLSNVEQYLSQNQVWQTFCNNFASLPLTEKSTFIYSQNGGGGGGGGGGLNSFYRPMLADVKAYNCVGGDSK